MTMDRENATTLIDALQARSGIVALVGAGGKKSTIHRLVQAHQAIGTPRIALTATVQSAAAPRTLDVETLIIDSDAEARAAAARLENGTFHFAGPPIKPRRFGGLSEQLIQEVHCQGAFDVTLVKADGARMRLIKAPNDHEPALPSCATTVLPVVSARAFGRPLSDKLAHRPELLVDVLDVEIGMELTPLHVAKLLTSQGGALRRTGGVPVVPIINMVDNTERLALSREAALTALSMTEDFDRVVLASMTSDTPLVAVVRK
jgi:probable selenium-dependent hydroxylase accessory protein YqeC